MKNISDLNIYPLSEENLKALLNYFFPKRPQGEVKDLCDELKLYNLTIKSDMFFMLHCYQKVRGVLKNHSRCNCINLFELDYQCNYDK